ncbi:MAG: hypothetical protein JF615_06860 [Asticcacaulis sp.]|nr:hypothetical protein [Asticcacaulis sp.]
MKIFINSASPYARKVRIVVREKGLLPQVEEVFTVPVESQPDLVELGLGQVYQGRLLSECPEAIRLISGRYQ